MITKKTHINPCFWTALWNPDYYKNFKLSKKDKGNPRDQLLIFLEINSNKELANKAENIHYEKNLGIAEISSEKLLDYYKEDHLDDYESLKDQFISEPKTFLVDFENHFTEMEKVYQVILELIRNGSIGTIKDKTFVAMFLIYHKLRSHSFIIPRTEAYKENGREKFELLERMKSIMSDTNLQYLEAMSIMSSEWVFYKSKRELFPLSDNPIVITRDKVFATISPYFLLIINRNKRVSENEMPLNKSISPETYKCYQIATINSTIKGLIFPNKKLLLNWKNTVYWNRRRNFVLKNSDYRKLVNPENTWEIMKLT